MLNYIGLKSSTRLAVVFNCLAVKTSNNIGYYLNPKIFLVKKQNYCESKAVLFVYC